MASSSFRVLGLHAKRTTIASIPPANLSIPRIEIDLSKTVTSSGPNVMITGLSGALSC
jgi:hypothetical protein